MRTGGRTLVRRDVANYNPNGSWGDLSTERCLNMLVILVSAVLLSSPLDSVPTGTELVYRGQFRPDRGEPGVGEKTFELSCFVQQLAGGAAAVPGGEDVAIYWTIEERGAGGWTWPNRFGKVLVDKRLVATGGVLPTLLYQRESGTNVVPVTLPFLVPEVALSPAAEWRERGLDYEVLGAERIGDVETWQVEARSSIGRKRSLWLEKSSPVVRALDEVVFVGQGEQHGLRYELTRRSRLDEPVAARLFAAFDGFARLRERLGYEPHTTDFAWTAERLSVLKSELPAVAARAQETPLARLAQAAELQGNREKDRRLAVGALESKVVGKGAPRPPLESLSGESFSWEDTAGKVTVLHFWEYRDTPLEEPYGQVAYLDFLCRKHPPEKLKFFGVVADERAAQSETRRAAVQSARRLHAFMNLSYPLLVDAGEATRQFGDPRVTGARLPLFVVIDRAGRVVHYHAGHYEVNRDRGLEVLDAVIQRALDSRE